MRLSHRASQKRKLMETRKPKHSQTYYKRKARTTGMDSTADVLLTVKDVAALDKCSEKTVRRAIEAGRLRAVRIGVDGRLIRIRKSDHAAYRGEFGF